MQPNTQAFVHLELRKAGSRALSQVAQLARANTLREVQAIGAVSLHPVVRSMKNAIPELRQLERAKERRAGELVEAQLKQLHALAAAQEGQAAQERYDAFEGLRIQLERTQWVFLPGNYPLLAQKVRREVSQLRALLKRELA